MDHRHHIPVVLFAEDFDRVEQSLPDPDPTPEPEVIEPAYTAADIAAARAQGFLDGHAEATTQAAISDQTALREALAAIARQLEAARDESAAIADASADAVARLLLKTLATLFPALCARHGEAELTAVLRVVLPALTEEPAITVRANPHDAPALTDEIARSDPDLAARIQLVPTDAMARGSVRIAWRHGTAVRDAAALWAQVADVLGQAGLLPEAAAAIREIEHVG
jgi:flagellar biosynthesis/type III secretory pathway protein FliH